ncbi:cation acetate symporter [Ignatzschineria ureiclastica]|uniref:Cation acetate symporter n=2 Tax=Ignatzschineria ureiclastica TaxID=472582 RepID=A0A2U2ADI1_9GAMM|nr:cation acetate symporter [Ignatzschineria ureiclastica]
MNENNNNRERSSKMKRDSSGDFNQKSARMAKIEQGSSDYFLAGRSVGSLQNAFALAGDYLSAAAFLGSIAMYFSQGMDSLFYAVATLIGWTLLLILFSEKLRATAAYTFSDVINQSFNSARLRVLSAVTSILISLFYLLVQLMGAGALLSLLFDLNYTISLVCIGLLTGGLVLLGGMKATTLVQSIKALLLFVFAGTMAFLALKEFQFSPTHLFLRVASLSSFEALMPSSAISSGIEQISLIMGLVLGLLGLPHVLMRFFTVKDSRTALYSAAGTTLLIALFFILNLIIGFSAYVLLNGETLAGGNNMALLHLASLLGGSGFKWILAILVFITVLAVIAGLVMAASASLTRDIIPIIWPQKQESLLVARLSVVAIFLVGMILAYLFQGMNLAFLFGIAFAWVASAHFPVMFCRFYLPGFSEKGAFYGLLVGAIGSLLFIVSSNTVWVKILGLTSLHPYSSPTLFILPLSFIVILLFRERKVGKREA